MQKQSSENTKVKEMKKNKEENSNSHGLQNK